MSEAGREHPRVCSQSDTSEGQIAPIKILRSKYGDVDWVTLTHSDHGYHGSEYTDHDGTAPVNRVCVASPLAGTDKQASIVVGRGARSELRVVTDAHKERAYPEAIADHCDWIPEGSTPNGE